MPKTKRHARRAPPRQSVVSSAPFEIPGVVGLLLLPLELLLMILGHLPTEDLLRSRLVCQALAAAALHLLPRPLHQVAVSGTEGDVHALASSLAGSPGLLARALRACDRNGYTAIARALIANPIHASAAVMLKAAQYCGPEVMRDMLSGDGDLIAPLMVQIVAPWPSCLWYNRIHSNIQASAVKFLYDNTPKNARCQLFAADAAGRTPLHVVADIYTLLTLLNFPGAADLLEAADAQGRTPLLAAAAAGHWGVAQHLLDECGVYAFATDNDGATALHYAAEGGQRATIFVRRMLATHVSIAEAVDRAGRTPMQRAQAACDRVSYVEKRNYIEFVRDLQRAIERNLAAAASREDSR